MKSRDNIVKKGKDLTESFIPSSENETNKTEKHKIKAGDNAYINIDYDNINFNNKI